MINQFYTHVSSRYGKIYYRGYEHKNGKKVRVHGKIPFSPTIYFETKEESEYKSIYGKNLKPRKFDTIPAAREYVKQYKGTIKMYGYEPNRWQYEFIALNYQEPMQVMLSELKATGFDIETRVGVNGPPGVPDPYLALEEITHIAFENHATGEMVSYTTAPITIMEHEGCKMVRFETEAELLEAIIRYIQEEDPDIIYGFYSEFFDVPYLINRINRVLGDDEANRLSPFGIIDEREYEIDEEVRKEYTIVGRTHYDIQAMYRKFVLQKEEKYSLDHLAKVNLGVGKLENPCTTFKQFSEAEEHIETFAHYNVIDTKRMTQLDKAKGLIALGVMLAYTMKCCFEDVYSPVRYWECSIQSMLLNEKKFVNIERQSNGNESIPGAYVSEPIPGLYAWLISIDAASLYPSIMKALNLSPETLVGVKEGVTVDEMLLGKTLKDFGITEDFTLAANGAMFRKDVKGIVPRVVDFALGGRKIAKNEMLRYKQLYVDTGDAKYKTLSDIQNVLQNALKTGANSLYGVFLQQGFMFYDPRLGKAITLSGQYIIMKVGTHCDKRFNEFFKTDNLTYTFYSDTDSCYLNMKPVVDKYWKDQPDLKIVDALDKLMETKLRPFINEATDEIARVQNHFDKTIHFKREAISSSGFWCAKKKYAIKVYDNEGVRYPDGDYKIMGIEVVRSSTPQLVRDRLKEAVKLIIDGKLQETRDFAVDVRKEFNTCNITDIAFPGGANNLAKWRDPNRVYIKGTPIAAKASLMYNKLLADVKDGYEKYDAIGEGDKIKYIYIDEPNPIREKVIAFVDDLPVEFNLHKYVDRATQYEKTFKNPLNNIFKAVGWELEEAVTLDEFF